jgi:predicted esterase
MTLAACGGSHSAEAPSTVRPFAHVTTAEVSAQDGLSCRAYVVWNNEPLTDVFLWLGGTGTATSAFVPEVLHQVLQARRAAFITLDKPGVTASFGDRSSVRIDEERFERHTQGTLLECAARAMRLAPAAQPSTTRWHFGGHSEGASIALDLLDRIIVDRPIDPENVKTLILTGLPLEPFDDIVRRQLASEPELARAVQDCNWKVMRERMGVSCGYLADASKRPSGFEMFRRIAAASLRTQIRVFQGNSDKHTPSTFVRQLEAWNAAQGHLDLSVRYYEGAHAGTPEVRQELSELLLQIVTVSESPSY